MRLGRWLRRVSLYSLAAYFGVLPASSWAQDRNLSYQKIVTPATSGASLFKNPTSLTIAPDGRIFFAQQNGRIHYVLLNSNFEVVGTVGRIDTIFNLDTNCASNPTTCHGRTVTGLAFGPGGDLFVSHSDGRLYNDDVDIASGMVTRVFANLNDSVPNNDFLTYQHVATGLPRSRLDHGPNGLAFHPTNGKLYLAQAGMTNAGIVGNTYHWTAPETAESAAIIEIDINTGFRRNFATGLRNPYDLLFHSNGKLYANDNGPNFGAGVRPIGGGNCNASTVTPDTPDELNIIVEYQYYGHPNPIRSECNFSEPGHTPPVATYGLHVSANGIAEYMSSFLPGLQSDIVTALYANGSIGERVVSVKLGANGIPVAGLAPRVLRAGLANPLDVATRADGSIFVAEYSVFDPALSAISVLRPKRTGRREFDIDGDGRTDIGFWRPRPFPANGASLWGIHLSTTSQTISRYEGGIVDGVQDILVPGDYDGDGKTDLAIWRPRPYETHGASVWSVRLSSNDSYLNLYEGGVVEGVQDIPVPGDYDGDGITDPAIWRPRPYETHGASLWAARLSSTGAYLSFNIGGIVDGVQDIPVPEDYDGDGKTDMAIWRPRPYPSHGASLWAIRHSSTGQTVSFLEGGIVDGIQDIPVPGDYDGDGKADVAIWRPRPATDGPSLWAAKLSGTGGYFTAYEGGIVDGVQDIPVPGDYDGDGKMDVGIWRPRPYPSNPPSLWSIRLSSTNQLFQINEGGIVDGVQDIPVVGK